MRTMTSAKQLFGKSGSTVLDNKSSKKKFGFGETTRHKKSSASLLFSKKESKSRQITKNTSETTKHSRKKTTVIEINKAFFDFAPDTISSPKNTEVFSSPKGLDDI